MEGRPEGVGEEIAGTNRKYSCANASRSVDRYVSVCRESSRTTKVARIVPYMGLGARSGSE